MGLAAYLQQHRVIPGLLHGGQLGLELLPLLAQLGHLGGGGLHGGALVGHVHGGLHQRDAGGQLLPLGGELGLLGGELLDGGADLALPLGQRRLGLGQLLVGRLLAPGQLPLAVGDLGLGRVELVLHLGQLLVHVGQYGGIDHVDAALLDGHVHLLLDDAVGGGGGHAVQALEAGHQLVVDVVGELQYVHVVPADGEDRHRQHVGVQLHGHRRAHIVVKFALELVQPGGDLDQRGVHVGPVVELHDDHAHVIPGLGGELFDVRQCGEGGLHGSDDLALHLLRRRAGIGGVDHHVGQVHAGQQVGGHVLEGDVPQHDHQQYAHDDGIGLFDGELGHNGPPDG